MKWSHRHSVVTGGVAGIALMHGHELWTLTLVLVAGFLLGRGWANIRGAVRWLVKRETPLNMRQWKAVKRRVEVLRPDDQIPF